MDELSVEKQDFSVIKEKIIKTHELLLLFNKKNEKLGHATVAFKHLKSKYENVLQELNRLKMDNERLSDTIGRLKPVHDQTTIEWNKLKLDYSNLEECYQQHLIKSQLLTTELEEKVKQCTCEKNLTPTRKKNADDEIRELKLMCSELKDEDHKLRIQNNSLMKRNKTLEGKLNSRNNLQNEIDCLQTEVQNGKEVQSNLQNKIEYLQQKHIKEVDILRKEISKLSSEKEELLLLKSECRTLKAQISKVENRNINKCDFSTETHKEVCVKSTQIHLDVCVNSTQTDPVMTIENTKQDFSSQTEQKNSIESPRKKCHVFTQTENVSNLKALESSIFTKQVKGNMQVTFDTNIDYKIDEMDDDLSDLGQSLSDIFSEMVLPEIISPMSHSSRSAESPSPPPIMESVTSLDRCLFEKNAMSLNGLPNIIITPPTPNVESSSCSSVRFPILTAIPEVLLTEGVQDDQKTGENLNSVETFPHLETVNGLNKHRDSFVNTQGHFKDGDTLCESLISPIKSPDQIPVTHDASKESFVEKDSFLTKSFITANDSTNECYLSSNNTFISSESSVSVREFSGPNQDVEDQSVTTKHTVADNSCGVQEKIELLFHEDVACNEKSTSVVGALDNVVEVTEKHEVINVNLNIPQPIIPSSIQESSKISEKPDDITSAILLDNSNQYSELQSSQFVKNSLSTNMSINNEDKFTKRTFLRRRKFWIPFGVNMFVKPKRNRLRPTKFTKKYKNSSSKSCNNKDTILNALRTLQQNNINFTISNGSLPSDDTYRYQATITSPLKSELIIQPENCKNTFSYRLTCLNKKCSESDSFMMLRKSSYDQEPELLGFFSVKPELRVPTVNRTTVKVPSTNTNVADLVQQLLHGLKELTGSKRKQKKSRNRISEFNSETESELERLFRKSADVLGRNRRLLAAAKEQSFESNGESFVESESEVMIDSGLVTATSKDTDSLTSFYSQNENGMTSPIEQQPKNANRKLLNSYEKNKLSALKADDHKSPFSTPLELGISSEFPLRSFKVPMNVLSPERKNKKDSNLREPIDNSPDYKIPFCPTIVSPLASSTKSSPRESNKKEDTISCFPSNTVQPLVEENKASSFPVNIRPSLCQKISFDFLDNDSRFAIRGSTEGPRVLINTLSSAEQDGNSVKQSTFSLRTSNFNCIQNDSNISNKKENGPLVSTKLSSFSDQLPRVELDGWVENGVDSVLGIDLSIKTSDLNCTLNDINISQLEENSVDHKDQQCDNKVDSDCLISPCAKDDLKEEIVSEVDSFFPVPESDSTNPSTEEGNPRASKRKLNDGFNVAATGCPQRKNGRTKKSDNLTRRETKKSMTLRNRNDSGTKRSKNAPSMNLRSGRCLTGYSLQQSSSVEDCIYGNDKESSCEKRLPSADIKDEESRAIASETSGKSNNETVSNVNKGCAVLTVESELGGIDTCSNCPPTDNLRLKNLSKKNFEQFRMKYTLKQSRISQTQNESAAMHDSLDSLNRKLGNYSDKSEIKLGNHSATDSSDKLITIDRSEDDKHQLNEYSNENFQHLSDEGKRGLESDYEISETNVNRDVVIHNFHKKRIITDEIQNILKGPSGETEKLESGVKEEIVTDSHISGHYSSPQNDIFIELQKSEPDNTIREKQPFKMGLKQIERTHCAHENDTCDNIRCGIKDQGLACNKFLGANGSISRNTNNKISIIQDIRITNGEHVKLLPVNIQKSTAPPTATFSRKRQKLEEQTCSKNSDVLSKVMQGMTRTRSKTTITSALTTRRIDIPRNRTNKENKIEKEDPFLDCPKSPDITEMPDRLPRLIPTEKPTMMAPSKVVSLMHKLMVFSSESHILDEVIREFAFQNVDFMVEVIIAKLSRDIHDKPDNSFSPRPPMTTTQRILLGFLTKLDKSTHPGILDKFLIAAEKIVLNKLTCDLNILQPFTRLYTAICRMRLDMNRIRRFTCECFYFAGDFALPILFIVLTMWPNVLPKESETAMYPLGKVIVQLCYLKLCNQPGYNLLPLRDLLQKYYGYPLERWSCDEVFQEILVDYIRNPSVKLSEFTLLLFLKNKPAKWAYQKVKESIMPLFQFIPDGNPNLKATLLILLGNICAPFNKYDEFEWSVINEMDNWFQNLQQVEKDPIVQSSLRLARTRLPKRIRKKRAVKATKNTEQSNVISVKRTEESTDFNVSDDLRLSESSLEENEVNNGVDSVHIKITNASVDSCKQSISSHSCRSPDESSNQSNMEINLEQGCDRVNSVENSESISLVSGQLSNVGVHLTLDKNGSHESDYSDIEF